MTGGMQGMLMVGKTPAAGLTGSVSPPSSNVSLANGSSYNQSFAATISGGTSPYTHAWSWQSGGFGTIGSAATATCTVSSPGFTNAEKFGTLQDIVTDSTGKQITLLVDIDVAWGTPL